MTVPSLWSGFASDATQVDVERAIAEIRAGRPVLLRDEAERVVALAAEAVDAALCAILDRLRPPSTRLALTAPRLRRLGLARREAGAIALPVLDMARLHALVADPEARIDAPAAASTPLEDGALELMRLAQVLPAAIVADGGAEAAFPGLLGVGLPDVLAYRAVRVAALRIVSRAQVPLEGAPDSEFVVFRGGEGLRDQAAIIVGRPDFCAPSSCGCIRPASPATCSAASNAIAAISCDTRRASWPKMAAACCSTSIRKGAATGSRARSAPMTSRRAASTPMMRMPRSASTAIAASSISPPKC